MSFVLITSSYDEHSITFQSFKETSNYIRDILQYKAGRHNLTFMYSNAFHLNV